jgi:hypothetical protein
MKAISILILASLILIACNATKELGCKAFKYKSKKRSLELIFDNDSICRLKNTFYCTDIDLNIRELTTVCRYKRINDTLYLQNINCKKDSCNYDLTVSIPPQQSKQCPFLNENERKRGMSFGPNYSTDYQKYGLVPNIDIDTLYVVKNKIILYKQDMKTSIGFIFK